MLHTNAFLRDGTHADIVIVREGKQNRSGMMIGKNALSDAVTSLVMSINGVKRQFKNT